MKNSTRTDQQKTNSEIFENIYHERGCNNINDFLKYAKAYSYFTPTPIDEELVSEVLRENAV